MRFQFKIGDGAWQTVESNEAWTVVNVNGRDGEQAGSFEVCSGGVVTFDVSGVPVQVQTETPVLRDYQGIRCAHGISPASACGVCH